MTAALHPVWLIAKRELRDQLRDWRILTPLIILTVGFPFLMNAFAYYAVELTNQYGGDLIVDRLVPFSVLMVYDPRLPSRPTHARRVPSAARNVW